MPAARQFNAYEIQVDGLPSAIPAFFVESTAPDNFDDKDDQFPTPEHCVDLGTQEAAIERIADVLAKQKHPKLVFTVHGFNSPRKAVVKTYTQSFLAVNGDDAIHDRGVVCIGYRWPSERIGSPWRSGLTATPLFLLIILVLAIGAVYLVNFAFDLCDIARWLRISITMVTATMALVPITLYLLRLIVYFRDGYRAATYGVPDFVDFIRLIDMALKEKLGGGEELQDRVDLSFIGHSMGGFVVTNTVRILSDLFSPAALKAMVSVSSGAESLRDDAEREKRSHIGKAFALKRLVLVSPDIPAETLLSGRANALRSSLVRFQEIHLFSNEGDEVLLDISTTANFFSLPTKDRKFGYRLGNVGVLTTWGITKGVDLAKLRVGDQTLEDFYLRLGAPPPERAFAQRLTYFDCTDSLENGEGVVTDVKPGESCDLSTFGHLKLLWLYVTRGRPDVHSGYFLPGFVGTLIYRFACIGYGHSEQVYGGFDTFSAACKEHQVKALRG